MSVACVVCGAASPHAKLRKQGVDILECPDCGLAFWIPPGDFRPEGVYDAAYFTGPSASHGYDDYARLEPMLRRNFARRLAKLPPPRPGARLLDVGAAFGFAIAEAETAGWVASGLEVSRAAAARACQTLGEGIVVADALRTPFASDRFDVVTLWDVLEHLSDPHAAIAEVARLLRPGGHLVLSTGDVGSLAARVSGSRWHLYNLPEHLFFYSRESLRRLLARFRDPSLAGGGLVLHARLSRRAAPQDVSRSWSCRWCFVARRGPGAPRQPLRHRHRGRGARRWLTVTPALAARLAVPIGMAVLWLALGTQPSLPDYERREEGWSGDFRSYYLPNAAYAGERLAAGELPLWNPHQGLGDPFLATLQVGALYPPNWLHALLPAPTAFLLLAVLHLALAAFAAGLLASALGAGALGSTVAAIVYAGSWKAVASIYSPPVQYAGAWAPLL
ncbi:MAG: methyltransferase domain-containing protein, partial [Myxococcota bacterium]